MVVEAGQLKILNKGLRNESSFYGATGSADRLLKVTATELKLLAGCTYNVSAEASGYKGVIEPGCRCLVERNGVSTYLVSHFLISSIGMTTLDRGYNIETLTVAPTEDSTLSRLTLVTMGSDDVIEQITKHLNRLVDVIKVVDLSEGPHIERELMLIKVRAVGKEREEMKRMADIFRGRIIDVTDKAYTIELTGNQEKVQAFIDALDRSAILETVRTGVSGIGRGERILKI